MNKNQSTSNLLEQIKQSLVKNEKVFLWIEGINKGEIKSIDKNIVYVENENIIDYIAYEIGEDSQNCFCDTIPTNYISLSF